MSRIGRAIRQGAAKLRALARALRGLIASWLVNLRDTARLQSRRRKGIWLGVAALLVLGPLAFNLARAADFKASARLFPSAVRPYPAPRDPAYYRELVDDPVLHREMRRNVDFPDTSYDDIQILSGTKSGPLKVTVAANTPADAARFVNALKAQIVVASQRQLARMAAQDVRDTQARLQEGPPRSERRGLRRRLRRLSRLTTVGETLPARVLPGAQARAPAITRGADRLVDDLPGSFRGRPSPIWAALAGLLVLVVLTALALTFLPPPRRGADRALPQPD
jgi:hypothetical protein